MNDKEKAKAYDEALERARALWREAIEKGYPNDYLKDYETIFPKLADSEDEKIYEEIYSIVHHCYQDRIDNLVNPERKKEQLDKWEKAKDWLEKQKEQKPAISTPIFRVGDYIRNKKTGDKVVIEQIDVKLKIYFYVSSDGVATVHSDFRWEDQNDWELIGQKIVHKPSEKQDYSGLTDLERAIHRGFLCAGVENVPVTIIKETAQDCLAQQKPVGWSDEDKKMLAGVLDSLKRYQLSMPNYQVELQRRWLYSLRPSWKPSEEQMEAFEDSLMSVACTENKIILESLLEQLKKLCQ